MKQEEDEKAGINSTIVRSLVAGNFFGEVACIFDCKRSATVTSRNFGTYGIIDKNTVETLFT